MANRWRYECDCHNCDKVEYVKDPANSRDGDYCIPAIKGEKTVRADDDYVIRCPFYRPKVSQMSFMEDR